MGQGGRGQIYPVGQVIVNLDCHTVGRSGLQIDQRDILLPRGIPALRGGPSDLTVCLGQTQPGQNVIQQGFHSDLVGGDGGARVISFNGAPIDRQGICSVRQGDGVAEVVSYRLPWVRTCEGQKTHAALFAGEWPPDA